MGTAEDDLVTTQQALTGSKLAVTLLAAPGWATPTNLLDGSTTTKSTNGATTASIELSLGGTFKITTVRVAEDNAGAQHVDAFGIQCWNGASYDAELFRETNTPVAVPGYNERDTAANPCTTTRVKVNLYNNAALEAFEVQLYGTPATPPPAQPIIVDAAHSGWGTMFPKGQVPVEAGQDLHFHFDPEPGYRLAKICTPNNDTCTTVHDTEYTLKNVTGGNRTFWASFEVAPTSEVQVPVQVLGSTFQTPAAVVDADVTNTKSLGTANNVAYIDLALDGYYQLERVQVFEDNGTWEIDQYGVQCWNGYTFENELFRANSANVVKPAYNQFVLGGGTCTTNRVRVNFYNNGAVETFGVKLIGKYRDVFHSPTGIVPLGSYRDRDGVTREGAVVMRATRPYVEPLNSSSQPYANWIYVEGRPAEWGMGTYKRNSVALYGVYVRHCRTGEWTSLYATSTYYPLEFPFRNDPAARTFDVYLSDHPDVAMGWPDPDFDCPLFPEQNYRVKPPGGQEMTIMNNGRADFAYVVIHSD